MNDRIRLSFYNLIESTGPGDDCQWLLISRKETDDMPLVEMHTLAFWWQVFPPINFYKKYRRQSNMLNDTTEMQWAKCRLWGTLWDTWPGFFNQNKTKNCKEKEDAGGCTQKYQKKLERFCHLIWIYSPYLDPNTNKQLWNNNGSDNNLKTTGNIQKLVIGFDGLGSCSVALRW